jgi:tight adherence protein B
MLSLVFTLGLLLAGIPYLKKVIAKQRWNRLMAQQLRQSSQAMAHSLQVGSSFLQALERAAQDGEDPLAKEWTTVIHSVRMGTSMRQALNELGERVPLREMGWFITAAQITQETGGSLAGVLESLAETLQERETLREKVSALTAQGKASGGLLSLLPFLMMAALYFIAPEFILPLFTTPSGQMLLAVIIILVTIGGLVIFKIVSIKAD